MADKNNHFISTDQLQIGVYVYLDVGWSKHPFTFNKFKIKDKQQIGTIQSLGLEKVRWDPKRSDTKPLDKPVPETKPPITDQDNVKAEDEIQTDDDVSSRDDMAIVSLSDYKERIDIVEDAFINASDTIQSVSSKIQSHPAQAVEEARDLVVDILRSMTGAPELALQVISGKSGNQVIYNHALNVTVITMLIVSQMRRPIEEISTAGLGAMLHDIGLNEVPDNVMRNRGVLNAAEVKARKHHCKYSRDICKHAKLEEDLLQIVFQHHEFFNGTGYPQGLKGGDIDYLAQIVGLVNHYDNLCNPQNLAKAMTPHESLSYMYAKQRNLFDPELLSDFISFMGVYPPGSVVELSDDSLGMVIKVYPEMPLKPTLILYDETIPKSRAKILDLKKAPNMNISKAVNPAHLPTGIYNYLSPQSRTNYYFDTE